jgi:hypothetical protein
MPPRVVVVVVEVAAGTVVAERVVCTVVLVVAGVGVSTTVVQEVSNIVGITTKNPRSGATAAARHAESIFFMPTNSLGAAAGAVCDARKRFLLLHLDRHSHGRAAFESFSLNPRVCACPRPPTFLTVPPVNRTVQAQLAAIRAEVDRCGGCVVPAEQLRLLCSDDLTSAEQFECIAAIAREEGWSFAFLSDGSVEFGTFAVA